MKRQFLWGGSLVVLLIVLIFYFGGTGSGVSADIVVPVSKGEFIVDVNTTGELEARNSIEIKGPSTLRNYRIWNVNIQQIIDEGTFVKKGQYVATLDRSELTNRMKDTQLELEQRESSYTQTQLDTALQMRQARDELINLAYAVEERKLVYEQSQFEPPATIKQAEIEWQKAQRAYTQAKENYEIKRQQNVAKMQGVAATRNKTRLELSGMEELLESFTILAPEDGMLIYKKGWDGKPIKAGSQISGWEPVVATLPDLSSMNSVTFVNEVDIRKINVGQKVDIGLDAFPDKKLTGVVRKVANVGEQRPNSDSKVFQVVVEIDKIDGELRPGMTTSNRIFTQVVNEALSVPLEALHSHNDSITYVYRKSGMNWKKQEVQVGETNSNEARILLGLTETDQVYLSVPSSNEGEIGLLPELDGKRVKKQEEVVPQAQPGQFPQQPEGQSGGQRRRPNA